ncbi:hypothetical protein PR202_gb08774 [Eleusine coracana subsp. coracana]|uniref:Histone-lysine N-methyltransferase ASHH2 n=1 Tax=Eleusine coracana subsp. coracana TaxID=191504 RepID=A0AAV5EDX1_ELECO|nr:hypothetical protein PR202_gb08774 [Eleusine coracana subsp. coracana]
MHCNEPHDIGELSEHRARVENVAFGSQGHTLLLENRFSIREVNTSEEDKGTGCTETAHDTRDLSDLREHHREELPCGTDGLTLITGVNHDLERVLPNVDPVGSCPVDVAPVLSIYESSIGAQYGISESHPERDLHSSNKLQQQCNNEPCFSGRESPTLCLGRQDFGVGGSGSLDLNACNSAGDKAGSVDFISNGNDTESESQQLSTVLVFRRRNPKRAASSRNLHSEKPDQINKASSGSRRPKKVEISKPLHQSTTGIAGSDASLENCKEVFPKLASYTSEFADSTNTQHLKSDLVSSAQEICAAEIHDSVLEVASVTCESNSSDAGASNGGSHHSIVLPTSYLGRNQAPSLMQLEQRATAGVSENMKSEDSSHTMMNSYADKGDVQTLHKSKTVRKNSVVRKQGSKKKDGTARKTLKSRSSTQISSFDTPKSRTFSNDAVLPDPSELLVQAAYPRLDSCFEVQTSVPQDHGNTQRHPVTDNGKGSAFHTMKSPKHKRKDANAGKKGKVRDSQTKGKCKKKNIADRTSLDCGLVNLHSTALATCHTKEQSDLGRVTELVFENSGTTSTDLSGNIVCKIDDASVPAPPRAAWFGTLYRTKGLAHPVFQSLAQTCKDNGDKAFADCSIPQEKSNAEINAELDLSDVSADEADGDGSNSKACRAPIWTNLKQNLFLHRKSRTQSIDESMVCNCKPPQDGRIGCGDGCLNRMLNIECVKRTCPCGEQCSNQQFQRRNYAKLTWFHSGKKGYGLQLAEDVSEGRFLIEYVGEVLDITSYESRQQYYASSKGQKHFYFMTLNGGEWMVNGEVCIGIFAMRNIKEGEELTFDYNYVRVSGAAPQKCFCGTAKCRGYIGGDISVADTSNQDNAAGPFEHTVAHKDSVELMGANGSGSHGSHPDIAEPKVCTQGEDLHDFPALNAELEPLKQTGGTLSDTSEPVNSLGAWCSQEDEDVVHTPVHVSRTSDSSLQHFPVHGIQSSHCLQQTPCTTKILKAPNVVNGSAPGADSGGNLVSGAKANKKNNLKHLRNVKQSSPIDNEHILGGKAALPICSLLPPRLKLDATNGYLKLLFLTAAEGDSSGGTSKSMRDLSLILDALLKTKSRAVLLDIINKNGLQMLHNILKQNRSNFHRIPILRKLLKVLEFLALKEILTSEHINGGPRCAGVVSFRDSMMSLTRHNDIQVHQIARNFRDRWIPRASTSVQDFRGNNMGWNYTRRKRKSRWDYQPDEHYKMVGLKFQKAYCEHGSFDVVGLMRNKMQGYQGAEKYQNGVHGIVNSTESADDEVPPGFESQQECQPVQALECEVAPGLCMGRYQPSLAISYGIPIALVQHIGSPEAEGSG